MRVVNARDALLTNLEVQQLLESQTKARLEAEQALPLPGARRGHSSSAAWHYRQSAAAISEQVLTYLESTSCGRQTRESIGRFIQAVEPFGLTRTEVYSLINFQPASVVDVHLVVEECEERLSQEDVRELLRLCATLVQLADDDEPATPTR
jgi:hypothetical protein